MLIYEVHLATPKSIRESFLPWLEKHMQEILALPGFTDATWFQPSLAFFSDFFSDQFSVTPSEEAWIVQYRVQNSEYLHEYLNIHAPRLRADGPGRFGQDLRIIGRRVLTTAQGGIMKTDLHSIKKELSRLANVESLKKEINRIAKEVKHFDDYLPLNDQAKERLNRMEKRFRELMKSLTDLQHQIDQNVTKFMKSMRGGKATAKKAGGTTKKVARKSSGKKPAAKKTTAKKTTSRKGKKA